MQYLTPLTLLTTLLSLTHTTTALINETLTVSSLTVYTTTNHSSLASTAFTIHPLPRASNPAIDCAASPPTVAANGCSGTVYSFEIIELEEPVAGAEGKFNLSIYKQTGAFVGIYERKTVDLKCHLVGRGSKKGDVECKQEGKISYTLTFDGQ